MTDGNQKCIGAAPIFKSRAAMVRALGSSERNRAGALARMIADPRA